MNAEKIPAQRWLENVLCLSTDDVPMHGFRWHSLSSTQREPFFLPWRGKGIGQFISLMKTNRLSYVEVINISTYKEWTCYVRKFMYMVLIWKCIQYSVVLCDYTMFISFCIVSCVGRRIWNSLQARIIVLYRLMFFRVQLQNRERSDTLRYVTANLYTFPLNLVWVLN